MVRYSHLFGKERLAIALLLQRAPDLDRLVDARLREPVVLHLLVHIGLRLDRPRHFGVVLIEAAHVA
jgi:hypothetical protein